MVELFEGSKLRQEKCLLNQQRVSFGEFSQAPRVARGYLFQHRTKQPRSRRTQRAVKALAAKGLQEIGADFDISINHGLSNVPASACGQSARGNWQVVPEEEHLEGRTGRLDHSANRCQMALIRG